MTAATGEKPVTVASVGQPLLYRWNTPSLTVDEAVWTGSLDREGEYIFKFYVIDDLCFIDTIEITFNLYN